MIDREKLIGALRRAGDIRVAVVGDFALDKYLYIDPARDEPSVETGLTAYQVHEKKTFAGAGGTVTNNLRALGAQVRCIGLAGEDGEGYELLRCLRNVGADVSGMIVSDALCTNTYTKPMRLQEGGGWVEMNRLDFRNFAPPPAALEEKLLQTVEACLADVDAVLILDQFVQRNSGVVTDRVRDGLNDLAQKHPKLIFYVDSRAFSGLFRHMTVKCNNFELTAMAGGDPEDPAALAAISRRLCRENDVRFFVTQGSRGMLTLENGVAQAVPAVPVTGPIDIVGAGDASSAGIVLGLALGLPAREAAVLGCCASAVTIRQLGVTGIAESARVAEELKNYQDGEA